MFKVLMLTLVLASCTPAYAGQAENCIALKGYADNVQEFKSSGKAQYEYAAVIRAARQNQVPSAENRAANRAIDATANLVYMGYSSDEIYTLCINVK